jgi:hypothetical protein
LVAEVAEALLAVAAGPEDTELHLDLLYFLKIIQLLLVMAELLQEMVTLAVQTAETHLRLI